MPTNFFKTVNTYGAMLNKLATANFFVWLIVFYFITTQSISLNEIASRFTLDVSISGFKIPVGFLVPPLVLAVLFRIIKLHDRISDIFGLRAFYDWEYVLKPIKDAVESNLDKKTVMSNRGRLMSKVFYKYASSRDDNPIVDKHLIEMVLDQLTWYWMIIESSFIVFCVFCILLYLEAFEHALVVFYFGLGLVVFSKVLQGSCSKYTIQEVEVILDSAPRKREIKEQFDALQN
ncbi:hypothetical protein EH243_08370 [Amphritea opalescens]|uniref:Uncharacterized protein n=1 Tax=Amphritea opalescens TaxID=2490544 RepID=A0A430KRK1_9GAMM|nr:hypothetical protein [Amphritea opalescens]RTE66125.1 hypothetical protein EH243_08370 [Amphritea opalescens]